MVKLNTSDFRKMVDGRVGHMIPGIDLMKCCILKASYVGDGSFEENGPDVGRIFPYEDCSKLRDAIEFPCTYYEHYTVEYIHELGIAAVHYPDESCVTCVASVKLSE